LDVDGDTWAEVNPLTGGFVDGNVDAAPGQDVLSSSSSMDGMGGDVGQYAAVL
jgi:hypothetical protein